ncbi:hypothetical protein [Nocardiopsis sp. CNT312]|uniref:hypothetical protein n=1 Tax=Nocardiopsis sp. CNT312 TaxID=1137268 RepID=UPI00048DB242|nr:hypothetical protein [Nocardiopsis sp. CNT312]
MTENGGGRNTGAGSTDSWFKPTENRYRTQSEYQDPLEGEDPDETVFPDSGGYSGLSTSRPALVEPYPEALGGPPRPPHAAPDPSSPPLNQDPISYPGAGAAAYRPLTRIPGEPVPEEEPAYPGVAASAQVPLPPETREDASPFSGGGLETPSWEEPGDAPVWGGARSGSAAPSWEDSEESGSSSWEPEESRSWEASADLAAPYREPGAFDGGSDQAVSPDTGTSWDPSHDTGTSWSPSRDTAAPSWEEPGDAPVWGGARSGSAAPSWEDSEESGSSSWEPEESRSWEASADLAAPYREPGAFDGGSDQAVSPDTGTSWDPSHDTGTSWSPSRDTAAPYADTYDDELSGTPSPASTRFDEGALGTGSGNTWAFGRDDERLPEAVREAERRRRESTPSEPQYQDWGPEPSGPETAALSAAVPESEDPLSALADMQTRAREQDGGREAGSEVDPLGFEGSYADHRAEPDGERAFDAPLYPAREEGDGYLGTGYEGGERYDQGYGEPYSDDPHQDYGDPDRWDRRSGESYGRAEGGPDPLTADAHRFDPEERLPEDAYSGGAVVPGVPSDLAPPVPYVQDPVAPGEEETEAPGEQEEDPEYDDGFTPADYGMPAGQSARRARSKRRRDPIAGDFPGFDDRPLGGEAGDAYPGYDSIDFLADTERGALITLWLGAASLLPLVGLATGPVALFVTGPKAKQRIRRSEGRLDGLGFITGGTVLATLGLLISVICVAFWFVL